jgi:hypothetical protein
VIDVLMLTIALLPSLLMARGYLVAMAVPGVPVEPISDAITYLAAGERLNAGHQLYHLVPGDRPVLILPQTFDAPLVSPPPIAALWRPLAALPFGLALWVAATWIAMLGTIVYLVRRTGWPAVAACVVLFDAIAQQLTAANVAAFFPALLIVAWNQRSRAPSAAALGVMTAIKIAPGTMFGWLVARRNLPALLGAVSAAAVLLLVGAIGAGFDSYGEFLAVARQTRPSPESLSGMTGLPWLSMAILVAGTLLAAVVRRDAWSFGIAIAASVLGAPALYHAGYVPLLAILAPLASRARPARLEASPEPASA